MKWTSLVVAAGFALSAYPVAATTVITEPSRIGFLSAGWVESTVRIQLPDAPFANPNGCSKTDGYITNPADTGHTLFNSMLLSAYMAGRRVELVIRGCFIDRPHIIGVRILND